MKQIFLFLSASIFCISTFAQTVSVKIDTTNESAAKIHNSGLKTSSRFIIDVPGKHPLMETIQLRNCSKELRVGTFISQMNFFKRLTFGQGQLDNQKVLFFSPDYKIDSNYLKENFRKIRHSLPKDYSIFSAREDWYDNEPNVDSIWFIQIFGQVDKNGFFKIYSAYKVTFNGTDASVDDQRVRPKIKNIEFIFDKMELQLLDRKLKEASKAG
jgi:hypothetical protein